MNIYKASMMFNGQCSGELWNGMNMFIAKSEELCDEKGLG